MLAEADEEFARDVDAVSTEARELEVDLQARIGEKLRAATLPATSGNE